eukprot:1143150-Rhodomonas_salina.1
MPPAAVRAHASRLLPASESADPRGEEGGGAAAMGRGWGGDRARHSHARALGSGGERVGERFGGVWVADKVGGRVVWRMRWERDVGRLSVDGSGRGTGARVCLVERKC